MTVLQNSLRATSLSACPSGTRRAEPAGSLPASLARLSGARTACELLAHLRGGALDLSLPGGARVTLGEGAPLANWAIHDLSVFDRVLAQGDIGLGESYMDGLWDSDQPMALLQLLASNREQLQRAVYGRPWSVIGHWIKHQVRANTRVGSRRNIEAHYDLGNDFYALWLDRSMSYSSALFERDDEPLVNAQLRKYRRVLDRLETRPGQTILEIGCGWGGFAEVAASEYGCRVLGLTLSPAQLDYARRRALRGGFAAQVDFELCDYRDVRGVYDHVVSIEMVEAVGERFWPVWFRQIAERLRPTGKAMVQAITIDHELFPRYRRGTDFIQRHIFPGGMLPSVPVFGAHAARAGLEVSDDLAFGRDYAQTLARWNKTFSERREVVRERGFDERFLRMWSFYLAYCEAGFRVGDIDVHQFEMRHRS